MPNPWRTTRPRECSPWITSREEASVRSDRLAAWISTAPELIRAYLDQVLVHGSFHADPHPGNVLLTPDRKLALVDLGMVSHLRPETQGQLLRLLLAVSSADGPAAAEALDSLGIRLDNYDGDRLKTEVGDIVLRYRGGTVRVVPGRRILLASCSRHRWAPKSVLAPIWVLRSDMAKEFCNSHGLLERPEQRSFPLVFEGILDAVVIPGAVRAELGDLRHGNAAINSVLGRPLSPTAVVVSDLVPVEGSTLTQQKFEPRDLEHSADGRLSTCDDEAPVF